MEKPITFILHIIKNENGGFSSVKKEWTAEPDEPNKEDRSGYHDLESVLRDI